MVKAINKIKKCKRCGLHFIQAKKPQSSEEMNYCQNCRDDQFYGTAVLFARVIEKMMRE
jgi:hypothetical protein